MLDIYDENMVKIGVMDREKVHRTGAWHRTFHCWVLSGLGEGTVLLQKRGPKKELFPNYLDITAAGHYVSGEKPADGIREVIEELGIAVQFRELVSLGIKFDIAKVNEIVNREFCDVFLLRKDLAPRDFRPNADEVEGLVEIDIQDGLDFFAGKKQRVEARGIEYRHDTQSWEEVALDIDKSSIIPRIDPYYYKIFIMAKGLLRGERYLSI
jgi:isopentenyldiphosphate isomerase